MRCPHCNQVPEHDLERELDERKKALVALVKVCAEKDAELADQRAEIARLKIAAGAEPKGCLPAA